MKMSADKILNPVSCVVAAGVLLGGSTACAEAVDVRRSPVRYADFGAKGDGVADDFDAIIAAHAHANAHALPVRADDGATYFIGGGRRTAEIKTDTDFGTAAFRIDDTQVSLDDKGASVFSVRSSQPRVRLEGLTFLKRDQRDLGIRLASASVVVVVDANVRQYIRRGLNENKGSAKTDVLLVAADGTIDPRTPPLWDFDAITEATAHPVDAAVLSVRGGRFTTIANRAPSEYTYFARGIQIERSNVRVEGLEHRVVGEGEHGAPYSGFIRIGRCADVEVRNVLFSGRKTYSTIGSAGKPVSMGSYDLAMDRAINVSVIGCTQANDIDDSRLWGVMTSNFCKNLLYEDCTLSRFDAHQGLFNGIVRRSRLRMINLIGGGTFRLEDSVVTGNRLISLRNDYGSTWQGDVIVRNTTLDPAGDQPLQTLSLIGGSNDGSHDFGYPCSMPHRVELENVRIQDLPAAESYRGPVLFGDFKIDPSGGKSPYAPPREVHINDVTTTSGLALRISDQPAVFADTKIVER